MSNLMICSNAAKAIHLNEAAGTGQKYILEGVFAELDKLNRNQRIYPKAEYLKHLAYLRDDIKKGEPLLGELDHPDDRFEVKLKEASHRVLDLWYDQSQNVVMGKIELLNTPNGLLAQSIVDQGIPLHISSRAAGSVNSDNTVSIQQIYTYDLVCKPGFAGAVLHRVNESADAPTYTDEVKEFLNKVYKAESMNAAPQYGILNEDVSVSEIKSSAVLRKEAKEIAINNQTEINLEDMSKPLYETENPDATVGKPLNISGDGAAALGIPTALEGDDDKEEKEKKEDVSDKPAEANDKPAEDTEKKDSLSDKKDEEDKKDDVCPKCGKTPCECDKDKTEKPDVSEDGNKLFDDKEEDEDTDKSDDDKDSEESDGDDSEEKSSDSGVKIIDVQAEFDGDDDMIKDVEPSFDDDDDSEEGDSDSERSSEEGEDGEDSDDAQEDAKDEAEHTVEVGDDAEKPTPEEEEKAKKADELADKASEEIKDRKDKILDKLEKLQAAIEKKNNAKEESKCESMIMAQYPISMRMNESNFREFAKLDESQKSKVVAYLHDNGIADVQSINENWSKGINYTAEIPVWLKYAPENYKALYESASDQIKKSLSCTAQYIKFENQNDVNTFWENSGLKEQNERRLINESFVNNMPKVVAPAQTNLPYNAEFIQAIANMASEYNKKY